MAKEPPVNTIGEDHMLQGYKIRQALKEKNHRERAMKLEIMKHAVRTTGTIRNVPNTLEPDDSAPKG